MPFLDLIDVVLPVLQLALIYFGLVFAMLVWVRHQREQRRRAEQDQNETLESKLRLLGESSSRAATLAGQIKVEIDAMTTAAEKATADAVEARRVADLSEEERLAVAAMVRRELGTELQGRDKRSIWTNIALSAVFFILGVVASVIVTLNVRPMEPVPDETPASLVDVVIVPVA
jgi:predicted histidine transporter YuiF (NhaC family)